MSISRASTAIGVKEETEKEIRACLTDDAFRSSPPVKSGAGGDSKKSIWLFHAQIARLPSLRDGRRLANSRQLSQSPGGARGD